MKFLKSKLFSYLLLLVLTTPAFFFLLKPGEYWNMHDDMQIIRQLEMEKCFQDGQIPCRWTPDLGYGYGYPLFNFYPPLPYLVGQFFRVFGFSFVATVKLIAITQIILGALFMYWLGVALFGVYGGILTSLFFTYAPYRNLNIYVRGAMNEAWASVFFPLIFYFILMLIKSKHHQLKWTLFLAISIAGLFLSHNPMLLTFAPFALFWAIYWLKIYGLNLKKVKYLIFSGLLSFGLSAFFTLPVLFESKLVQIESMFQNYYHYSVHFTSLYQLFISNFWSDGPSVWGQADQMSFQIGYLHWIIPLLLSIYSLFLLFKKRQKESTILILFIVAMGLFTAFMTHERSSFLWQILTPIQKIQFPWRFLNHTAFFLALASGSIFLFLKKTKINPYFILLPISALLLALNWSHLTPITHGPITDTQKLTGQAWNNQITSGIYDYLPKTASTAAKSPAKDIIDSIYPVSEYQVTGLKEGTNWSFFNLYLPQDSQVILSTLYFPDFRVFDFGQKIDIQVDPILGRIKLNLSSGDHQLYVKLYDTPIRIFSNYLSLLSFLFLIWKLLKLRK